MHQCGAMVRATMLVSTHLGYAPMWCNGARYYVSKRSLT